MCYITAGCMPVHQPVGEMAIARCKKAGSKCFTEYCTIKVLYRVVTLAVHFELPTQCSVWLATP